MFLSPISLALNRPGARSLEQKVAALFSAGEQGAWYDPSGNNTTWRRNRFQQTEALTGVAFWPGVQNGSIAVSAATPPSGFTQAYEMQCTTNGYTYINKTFISFSFAPNGSFTLSAVAKRVNKDLFTLDTSGSSNNDLTQFNLATGAPPVPGSNCESASMVALGDGWYRCSVTRKATAASSAGIYFGMLSASSGDKVLITGLQIEDGPTLSAYQRIITPEITYLSTVQAQPLLFQDSAGTLPVTEVEQPVGLILDKRKGLVLGPELVTNGTFDTASDWTLGSGWSITGGKLVATSVAFGVEAKQAIAALVTGSRYVVTFDAVVTSGAFKVNLGGLGVSASELAVSASGSYKYIPPRDGTAQITFWASSTFTGTIDNVSIKLLDGNHAYQTSTPARPHLRSRYNLLTYSEQFTTNWPTALGAVVTGNLAVAPDGTTTGDLLSIGNGVTNAPFLTHTVNPSVANDQTTRYTFSIYAKSVGAFEWLQVNMWNNGVGVWFNTKTGQVGASNNGTFLISKAAQDVGNGWYRFVLTAVFPSYITACNPYIYIRGADNSTANITGDGTSGIYLWGAQLNLGSTAMSYQRIAAAPTLSTPPTYATTSTMGGEVFRPYLFFDGADELIAAMDAMDWIDSSIGFGIKYNALGGNTTAGGATNSTSGNSFVYVRETSGVLAWTSSARNDSGTTAGADTFGNSNILPHILTGTSTVSTLYVTLDNASASTANIAGPITSNRLCMGALSRNSTSAYINGHIYGAIMTRRSWTAAELTTVKNYLAQKTGVTL